MEARVVVANATGPVGFSGGIRYSPLVGVLYTHFNQWQWVKGSANVSRLLVGDGLLIYDETGRVYNTLMRRGLK